MAKLKRISFSFVFCSEITDLGLKAILNLPNNNLHNLEEFKINFSGCKLITGESKNFVVHSSSAHTKLKTVSIDLARCSLITDKGIKTISNFIGVNFHTVQNLSLDLNSATTITDKGMTNLAKEVCTHFKNIERTALNFTGCTKITNEGAIQLCEIISKGLSNLNEFCIDVMYCPHVSRHTKPVLVEKLKTLPQALIKI